MTNSEHWGMPGGYSSPHDPTAAESFLLKKVWFESVMKCADLPEDFDKIKICSVRRQVVAGMNYKYSLSDGKHDFNMVVYVPLHGAQEKVTLCERSGTA